MTQEELLREVKIFKLTNSINEEVEPIPKSELIVGQTYQGTCRNASEAEWTGDRFRYWRVKWGSGYWESIKHYEDDDGYDVFVPMKIKPV